MPLCSAASSAPSPSSVRARARIAPMGIDPVCVTSRCSRRDRSRLPPPRSAITPSALGMAERTPQPEMRASSSPDSRSTGRPSAFTASKNTAPFSASRTAAVATTRSQLTSQALATSAKRASPRRAISLAALSSRPSRTTPPPRPAASFSLYRTTGALGAPPKTTNRTELEPISMTALR